MQFKTLSISLVVMTLLLAQIPAQAEFGQEYEANWRGMAYGLSKVPGFAGQFPFNVPGVPGPIGIPGMNGGMPMAPGMAGAPGYPAGVPNAAGGQGAVAGGGVADRGMAINPGFSRLPVNPTVPYGRNRGGTYRDSVYYNNINGRSTVQHYRSYTVYGPNGEIYEEPLSFDRAEEADLPMRSSVARVIFIDPPPDVKIFVVDNRNGKYAVGEEITTFATKDVVRDEVAALEFNIPNLNPNLSYSYLVEIRYHENGKLIRANKRIRFSPRKSVAVKVEDFTVLDREKPSEPMDDRDDAAPPPPEVKSVRPSPQGDAGGDDSVVPVAPIPAPPAPGTPSVFKPIVPGSNNKGAVKSANGDAPSGTNAAKVVPTPPTPGIVDGAPALPDAKDLEKKVAPPPAPAATAGATPTLPDAKDLEKKVAPPPAPGILPPALPDAKDLEKSAAAPKLEAPANVPPPPPPGAPAPAAAVPADPKAVVVTKLTLVNAPDDAKVTLNGKEKKGREFVTSKLPKGQTKEFDIRVEMPAGSGTLRQKVVTIRGGESLTVDVKTFSEELE